MARSHFLTGSATLAACLSLLATPAFAGKKDRAQAAIAAAEAKIQTNDSMGVATTLPARQAEARELLNNAKADLKAGHKTEALEEANRAAAMAEAALGETQKRKAAEADAQTEQAQAAAANAQADAQAANARAANAETTAAVASVQAAAAQQAAANAAAPAPQVETTVTTENKATTPARKVTRTKVVRRKASTATTARATAPTTTTTTTVTQSLH